MLNGTNYHDWPMLMEAYLQMQKLWDLTNSTYNMLREPQPNTTTAVPTATMVQYCANYCYEHCHSL